MFSVEHAFTVSLFFNQCLYNYYWLEYFYPIFLLKFFWVSNCLAMQFGVTIEITTVLLLLKEYLSNLNQRQNSNGGTNCWWIAFTSPGTALFEYDSDCNDMESASSSDTPSQPRMRTCIRVVCISIKLKLTAPAYPNNNNINLIKMWTLLVVHCLWFLTNSKRVLFLSDSSKIWLYCVITWAYVWQMRLNRPLWF